ncbi:ABC transporter permease YtrF [Patescibacteria group bacterium]|nr:ABC transporter permease YtrF [Patescibacteria group bacterium]
METIKAILKDVVNSILYTVFLTIYLISKLLQLIFGIRIFPPILKQWLKSATTYILNSLNTLFPSGENVKRLDLVEMSLKTLVFKRVRTIVTVGGMAIGIGVIVLLVSIGYGLQDFVISQVATFEAMKHIDVTPQIGQKVSLNSKSLENIKEIEEINQVFPIYAVIAQVSYAGSVSTVAAYGIDSEYLVTSEIDPVQGQLFENRPGLESNSKNRVLGIEIEEDAVLETVSISEEVDEPVATKVLTLGENIQNEIVVNTEMLKLLGIGEGNIIDKNIKVIFRIPSELLSENEKLETETVEYRIVGLIEEGSTPIFYFPIENLNNLQLQNYSSLRVIVSNVSDVVQIREKINAMGFATGSVVDTVNQIQILFDNIRVFLTLLGMVALLVASLGVFNTLTVSLLERTKEVGLLKAMGMNSLEIQQLFLTESLLLALTGCFLGIGIGIVVGKILSALLSLVVLPKGMGWLDISHVPPSLVLLVIFLSLLVGLATGIYPAQRAKKISALDALRYE